MATKKKTTKQATPKKTAKTTGKRSWTAPNPTNEGEGIATAVDDAISREVAKPKKARRKIATDTVNRADFVTFALRLPKDEAAAFHGAAGPRRGSLVARELMRAYANAENVDGFRNLLDSRAN